MQTTLEIVIDTPEATYDSFSIDLNWNPAEPDVGLSSMYVEDWDFSSPEDKETYNIIEKAIGKETLDKLIEEKVSEADQPEYEDA